VLFARAPAESVHAQHGGEVRGLFEADQRHDFVEQWESSPDSQRSTCVTFPVWVSTIESVQGPGKQNGAQNHRQASRPHEEKNSQRVPQEVLHQITGGAWKDSTLEPSSE